jgi:menaquinol-cytochrome c reductase iron-sulfur subunit
VISRRTFLSRLSTAFGALIAAAVGAVSFGYLASPLFEKRDEDWVDVGRTDAFKPGAPTRVEFVERRRDAWVTAERRAAAWVATSNGRDFIVFDPRCTHLGCPYRWDAERHRFLCPCHTAVFEVDGAVVSGPAPRPLDRYACRVVGGRLLVRPVAQKEHA